MLRAPQTIIAASGKLLARVMAKFLHADCELKHVDANELEAEFGLVSRGILRSVRQYLTARAIGNKTAMESASTAMQRLTKQLQRERRGSYCEADTVSTR